MLSFGKEHNSVAPLNRNIKIDLSKKNLKKLTFEDDTQLPPINSLPTILPKLSNPSSNNLWVGKLESQTLSSESSKQLEPQ